MGNPVRETLGRPLRLALVGGAPPSMIGPVHRMAAQMDGLFQLVAGVLSSRPERSRAEGVAIGLDPERAYGSFEEMLEREAARADGIEAVAIITPNDSHARYLRAALAAGLDVMMEKPLCNDLAEARALQALARRTGCAVALTHTYSGYPMLRELRARVLGGAIGAVRMVTIEYFAGGNASLVEATPEGAARWRLNPAVSGPSLVLGDIGTHAHHLAAFVTGQPFESVSAEVGALVPGRKVHDVAQVRFRLANGARGRLDVCNAAAGTSNELNLRVFGESGHLAWTHAAPARLRQADLNGDVVSMGVGQPNVPAANAAARLARPGHPEGLIEAVANLYAGLAAMILTRRGLAPEGALAGLTPTIEDGVAGLEFVTACLESAAADGRRTALAPNHRGA